jgi:hypothetical protein
MAKIEDELYVCRSCGQRYTDSEHFESCGRCPDEDCAGMFLDEIEFPDPPGWEGGFAENH